MNKLTFFLFCFAFLGCDAQDTSITKIPVYQSNKQQDSLESVKKVAVTIKPQKVTRDSIMVRLRAKRAKKSPLVFHVFVPLCDNKHQGIVPVNDNLGNGKNLRTNLYWGAGYGVKSYFKYRTDWKTVYDSINTDSVVMERVIYKKVFSGQPVYIVADAYRGDQMKLCINHYLQSLAGRNLDYVNVKGVSVPVGSGADCIVFNGHNGLMDNDIPLVRSVDGKARDAVAIACASKMYFNQYYQYTNSYPLVQTTNLMVPEAYVLHGIIKKYISLADGMSCKNAAGDAYNSIQQCGQRGARNLFSTGWTKKN